MRSLAVIGLVALSLLLGGSSLAGWPEELQERYERYIARLPACDRVVVIRIGQPVDEPPAKTAAKTPQGPDSTGKLYHVEPYDEWWKIAAQATVAGADAERLAALYRALKMVPFETRELPDLIPEDEEPGRRAGRAHAVALGANCHFPPFAYRFYAGDKLLYDTSVCWGCANIIVGEDGARRYLYFRSKEKEALAFFDASNRLFPEHPAGRPKE